VRWAAGAGADGGVLGVAQAPSRAATPMPASSVRGDVTRDVTRNKVGVVGLVGLVGLDEGVKLTRCSP
jgi:hypothetical protein